MNSNGVKLYSKNDLKTIIYLILLFLWNIIFSIITYYYNNVAILSGLIWLNSAINIVFCILTIIGLYTRNTFFINSFKNFKNYFFRGSSSLSHVNYNIVILNILNLIINWKIENFRKRTNEKFDDYSDEELRKYLLLSTTLMVITGIINIIIIKKSTSYLKEYLNNFNAYQDKYSKIFDLNNYFRKYSQDEKDATITSFMTIYLIIIFSILLLYLTYAIRERIDIIFKFIAANSVYGIISLLLIIIGIHKKNIFLIKNYKRIPWNKSLIVAHVINAISFTIHCFIDEKTSDDKIEEYSIPKLIILILGVILINAMSIIYYYELYKMNSKLDKYTDNIIKEIKKYNKIKNLI